MDNIENIYYQMRIYIYLSMVKIPACDSFLLDTDKADELAKTLLDSYNEEFNKANLTKNVQGNDIDILSVKKYMLDFKPIQELPTGRGEEALQTSYFFLSQSIGTIILHLSLN